MSRSGTSGSRFWRWANFVVAPLLGGLIAGLQRAFDWSGTTVLLVGIVIVAVWVPLALWLAFVKGSPHA